MTGTTRISAADITGVKGALIKRFARKTLGQVPSSLGVYWHNQKVLMSMAGVGGKVQKWDACDEQLFRSDAPPLCDCRICRGV